MGVYLCYNLWCRSNGLFSLCSPAYDLNFLEYLHGSIFIKEMVQFRICRGFIEEIMGYKGFWEVEKDYKGFGEKERDYNGLGEKERL